MSFIYIIDKEIYYVLIMAKYMELIKASVKGKFN